MTTIKFFSKIRKKIAKKDSERVIYQYYITIPIEIVKAFEVDKFIGKEVKVVIEVEDGGQNK